MIFRTMYPKLERVQWISPNNNYRYHKKDWIDWSNEIVYKNIKVTLSAIWNSSLQNKHFTCTSGDTSSIILQSTSFHSVSESELSNKNR